MQPDITAPGVQILAAFTQKQPEGFDKRVVDYQFLSGTSMSCPHISGIVGLFKTLHPDWSPSAIKSALMTTGKIYSSQSIVFFSHIYVIIMIMTIRSFSVIHSDDT